MNTTHTYIMIAAAAALRDMNGKLVGDSQLCVRCYEPSVQTRFYAQCAPTAANAEQGGPAMNDVSNFVVDAK